MDLRSPLALVILAAVVASVALASVLPDRHPEERERACVARDRAVPGADFARALADTGFSSIGSGSGVVEISFTALRQSAPATITASDSSTAITLRDGHDTSSDAQAILYSASGSGVVDAPLVFAGGASHPPTTRRARFLSSRRLISARRLRSGPMTRRMSMSAEEWFSF